MFALMSVTKILQQILNPFVLFQFNPFVFIQFKPLIHSKSALNISYFIFVLFLI